jgi:dihydrolipoamide dehydrogenase
MRDLIVVGAGPGGYVAAIRAAQLGMTVTIVEREQLGGVCLNWGCIPSKALLRNAEVLSLVKGAAAFGIRTGPVTADYGAAIDRSRAIVHQLTKGVQGLLKSNGVEVIHDTASLAGRDGVRISGRDEFLHARNVLLAVGARPRHLPGVDLVPGRIVTSREALEGRDLPGSVVIIGGGAIGCEFATIWRAYGADVIIVDVATHLLANEDVTCSVVLETQFRRQGITLRLNTTVRQVQVEDDYVRVELQGPAGDEIIRVERVLVAIGSRPNSDQVAADTHHLTDARGFVSTDAQHRTTIPGVWAIGDLTGPLLLAHVASEQGIRAVEAMAGHAPPPLDYVMMPRATYSHPEVASLGHTEAQARDLGRAISVGIFPMQANSRALAHGDATGLVKVVADQVSGELLGVHMVGHGVSELLGEALLGVNLETSLDEIERTVHPHPTLSEAFKEAVLKAMGRPIHLPKRQSVPSTGVA